MSDTRILNMIEAVIVTLTATQKIIQDIITVNTDFKQRIEALETEIGVLKWEKANAKLD